ncbi:hypothetical protein GJAV_G00208760 [Gymnothorax javanicus]|nr:hypothetical protein GJAV_G00208760 [Gymnothorax javanicus]
MPSLLHKQKLLYYLRLKNPSNRPLQYHASILGPESVYFSLPQGPTVTIPPKRSVEVPVHFSCCFLRPMEALLLFTARASSGPLGATLSFSLRSEVVHIAPTGCGKCRSPCYQLAETKLKVLNRFSEDATFRVILLESQENLVQECDGGGSPKALIQSITAVCSADAPHRDDQQDGGMKKCAYDAESAQGLHFDHTGVAGIREFFSPWKSVLLLSGGSSELLQIQYLPFHPGKKYCYVLLLNQQVGDMVYVVDGTAELPPPSPLISKPSPNLVHLNKPATGASRSRPSLCFRCDVSGSLRETVCVPLVNEAWEKALVVVAERGMSPLELERRRTTRTVGSSTVRADVAATGLAHAQTQVMEYSVEVSMSEHFKLPDAVTIPVGSEGGAVEGVWVPVQFVPGAEGRYQCQVVLRSWQDVRVHVLEVIVHGRDPQALLEFTVPAHKSVTQDIPLNSENLKDCHLRGVLSVPGFSGPSVVHVKAGQRLSYPVTFQPTSKCVVMGHLSLINESDGTEYTFGLRGVGERPLAQEHVQIHCTVGTETQARLQVPNYSQSTAHCKIVSDLSFIRGPPTLEIKPGRTVPYAVVLSPWKRGLHKGVISFVAEEREGGTTNLSSDSSPDSILRDPEYRGEKIWPYEVWFSMEVICSPAPPMKVMTVRCTVHSSVTVEIPVTNTGAEPVQLQVLVEGLDLTGDVGISVPGWETLPYLVHFSPATVGNKSGSVVFQCEALGEFWYQLDLLVDPPAPTTLPDCCCELGKWIRISIPLNNPTDETLELDVLNSNPRNFILELDTNQALIVEPHSSPQVPVRFCPSAIGQGNHTATICFTCTQLGEWVFLLSGTGLTPSPMELLSISSRVGSQASVILPFRNPMEEDMVAHVFLTADDDGSADTLHPSVPGQSHERAVKGFSIRLRKTQGITLAPDATIEGAEGGITSDNQHHRSLTVSPETGCLQAIRWVYPIHGIPEAVLSASLPAVIRCQARSRAEERLEVQLTGCVPGTSAPPVAIDQTGSGHSVAAGSSLTQEDFLYEILFEREEAQAQLEHSVALSLQGCERDSQSGIVSLAFSVVFAPCKPARCVATLAVQCITGGLWKFPIMLISTEPQVDDVINIEAAGLNKTSGVGFRLTSQSRHPEPFTARFLPGSGPEFQVSPASGELLPVGSAGTLLTVTFTPSMYSKKHQAALLVQTADMQWTYEVNGVLPVYTPPCPLSVKTKRSNKHRPTQLLPTPAK